VTTAWAWTNSEPPEATAAPWLEADEKYTVVHCGGHQYLIRLPIAELVTRLDPDQFWQVHRATLINLNPLQRCRRDDNSHLWLQMRGMVRE
jgi:DNA-binding LytR/AlgR family response regulator